MATNLDQNGYAMQAAVLSTAECLELIAELGPVEGPGRRGLLSHPVVANLAHSDPVLAAVHPHLPGVPRAVRAIYFDKSPDSNWLVPWHQDLTIAVTRRIEHPGFGPWSEKDGLIHVQPPASYLAQMITIRLHLDLADETNGALRVLPGSHLLGKLSPQQINQCKAEIQAQPCIAARGDALLMRPLLLHASSRSTTTQHRRILHIEYASNDLPTGLSWNAAA
jgi:Phytanoyl-CoA dioxygenase (PhyH)